MSCFEGFRELIKPWTIAQRSDFEHLPLSELFDLLKRNYSPTNPSKFSDENWRFTQNGGLAEKNTSPEKILEYTVPKLMGEKWANQVPTCSGFTPDHGNRHRRVDWVVESSKDSFTFYELKVLLNSGDAFHASIELLEYGFAYLYTRSHLPVYKDKPLMKASALNLRVLGTDAYYQALIAQQERRDRSTDKTRRERRVSPTKAMELGINVALAKFLKKYRAEYKVNFAMDFGFSTFPLTFKWDEIDRKKRDEAKIVSAVKGIDPLFENRPPESI